ALGSEHRLVAQPLNGLAVLFQEQGRYVEAAALFQRALSIREQRLGRDHPETAQTLHDLAIFRQKRGNVDEALSLAARALQIRSQCLGDAHPQTVATRTLAAQLAEARGTMRDGGSFPRDVEEHPDYVRTAPLQEKAVLTSQETSDGFPSENDPLQEF